MTTKELSFTCVNINKISDDEILFIDFQLNTLRYYMIVMKRNGKLNPETFYHNSFTKTGEICPLCNKAISSLITQRKCKKEVMEEIYKQLIEHPSLRIRLLFY